MKIKSFPACFVRGGTSNGLIIHRRDLPKRFEEWQPILASAMGSPDSFGRQLDGMGSGVSSTSKICVVEKSHRPEADLDFTFVQVGIKDGSLDVAGNCGNMSSVVGPFALNEGLLKATHVLGESEADRHMNVRVFNTNTNKIINASFHVTKDGVFDPFGDYAIDGVPGTSSRITLSFLDPSGAKTGKALPTGNAVDTIQLSNGSSIKASLVDVANPGVFVLASDLKLPGDIKPTSLEEDTAMMARLEDVRQEGAKMMGMDPKTQTVPKIVIISKPDEVAAKSGVHIVCRALSMQQPHKAVPLTLALNLGAACRMPGTLPAMTALNAEGQESLTIAHASGKVEVGSVFEDGAIKSALLHRTARIMMKGDVFYSAQS
ncbi:Putative PrpF protein [Septoria linicola]|uniref:PrpF protein n=1 Tax=Septoria linicola TaxID=215465 RepID=A0A9Q9B591_9PEZI|nr:Putative PrpF protein [Septoria linicola]